MGVCASTSSHEETHTIQPKPAAQKESPPQQQQQTKSAASPSATTTVTPATSASTSASTSISDDDDYRSQLKFIFLHLVDRCIQVMELERESVSTLAALRYGTRDASYLTLFGSSYIEDFLRASFDVDQLVSRVPSGASPLEREQAFAVLVKAAQQRADQTNTTTSTPSSTHATPSRQEFTRQIKKACEDVQNELRATLAVLDANSSAFARYHELKKSLNFFIKTFNFTRGDISNDSKLLEKNVEEIIQASSE